MKIKLEPSPLEFRPKPRVEWEWWGWLAALTFLILFAAGQAIRWWWINYG